MTASKTTVVNCRKSAGQEWDVYIGRRTWPIPERSKWANPFAIGKDGTREEVIAKYRAWIQTQPELLAALPELKGKRLGCWCSPLPCHGDVLAELANALPDNPE